MRLPVPIALALAEAAVRTPGPTPLTPAEVRAAAHWWTYRSAKARRELGWKARPHEDTVEATVRFHRERLGDRLSGTRQPLPLRVVGWAVRVVLR